MTMRDLEGHLIFLPVVIESPGDVMKDYIVDVLENY